MKNFINLYRSDYKFFFSQVTDSHRIIGGGQQDRFGFIKVISNDISEDFGLIIANPNGGDLIVTQVMEMSWGYLAYAHDSSETENFLIALRDNPYGPMSGSAQEIFLWYYQTQNMGYPTKLFVSGGGERYRITEYSPPLDDTIGFQWIQFADFEKDSTLGYGYKLQFLTDRFRFVLKSHSSCNDLNLFFLVDRYNLYIAVCDLSEYQPDEILEPIQLECEYPGASIETFGGYFDQQQGKVHCYLSGGYNNEDNIGEINKCFTGSFDIELNHPFEITNNNIKVFESYRSIKSNKDTIIEDGKIIHKNNYHRQVNYDITGRDIQGYIKGVETYQYDDYSWVFHHEGDSILAKISPETTSNILRETNSVYSYEERFYIAYDSHEEHLGMFRVDDYTHQLRNIGHNGCIADDSRRPEVNFIETIGDGDGNIDYEYESPQIQIHSKTMIQSPYTTLLAAGSTGEDGSVEGIHLRWLFNGELGDKHLPKGELHCDPHNFNKWNDYVRILRTPYNTVKKTLNLNDEPAVTDYNKGLQVYNIDNERKIYFYLIDTIFGHNYNGQINRGDIIEIISDSDLFFKVGLYFDCSSVSLQTEVLSEVRNNESSPEKTVVSSRKKQNFTGAQRVEFDAENGRGIRLKVNSGSFKLNELTFEFYSDIADKANNDGTWEEMGKFSLDGYYHNPYEALEHGGEVHAQWPRFTKGAGVNIQNYKNRWAGTSSSDLNGWGIREVVSRYLKESRVAENPTALIDYPEEVYEYEEGEEEVERSPDEVAKISLLELINFGATDFHIARMLGLGTIDSSSDARSGNKYIYLLEYYSEGDLKNGNGDVRTHHLYFSIPTSKYDERLPIPVKIKEIKPGIEFDDSNISEDYGMNLVGNDGYSVDGRFRYVTLIATDEIDCESDEMNLDTGEEFDLSNTSFPIYAGVRYKLKKEGAVQTPTEWLLPELSNDPNSECAVLSGDPYNETIPIIISENKRIIYVHKQKDSGIHYYKPYGINIFSRPDALHDEENENVETCITKLRPANLLKSPTNIQPFLIREEDDSLLTFSTLYEQNILKGINENEDKTLVRLLFDYNYNHDSYNYQISEEYHDFSKWELLKGRKINSEEEEEILIPYNDDTEVYADNIEIFLRNKIPVQVTGKINRVEKHPTNELLSIIYTEPYNYSSTKTTVTPNIAQSIAPNFRSGVFLLGKESYVISRITTYGNNPTIEVFNREISQRMLFEDKNEDMSYKHEKMVAPDKETNGGLFTAIENMQLVSSWKQSAEEFFSGQEALKINIASSFPTLKREIFKKTVDDEPVRFIEKSRGFWEDARIEKIAYDDNNNIITDANGNPIAYEENSSYSHKGLYRVVFNQLLPEHSQKNNFEEESQRYNVKWHNGQVRLLIASASDSDTQVKDGENSPEVYYVERKSFDVILTTEETHVFNNVGKNVSVLYFEAPDFISGENNETKILKNQQVCYYPGYKVYLKSNSISNLNQNTILPSSTDDNEEVRYSIFGLRSYKQKNAYMLNDYYSKVSIPAVMFAQKITPPMQPQKPEAPAFSTRPDSFGKSSFSFTTTFNHKPDNVLFYRSNENAMLNALYEPETIEYIRMRLGMLGGTDERWVKKRWEDFVNFSTTGRNAYKEVPETDGDDYNPSTSFALPLPDVSIINKYIKDYNAENNTQYPDLSAPLTAFTDYVIPEKVTLIQFIKESIYATFVPLTEVPVIYKYIKNIGTDHRPVPKKQNIRDRNGNLLKPDDSDFEMAPMAGIINGNSDTPQVQFVDFTIDGTNRNVYFYCAREMNMQMQMGEFSGIIGPIKTVDTHPPVKPELISVIPALEEEQVEFEIYSYIKEQNIRKITIYRAYNSLDARSIRTITPVKQIELDNYDLDSSSWSFADDFMVNIVDSESGEEKEIKAVPFGDPLFYRITVSRWVQYTNYSTTAEEVENEYVESVPSKLISTMMVESKSPEAPVLTSDYNPESNTQNLKNVVLTWNKTAYKATYYIYKMNSQGNWTKIYELKSFDNPLRPLEGSLSVKLSDTEVNTATLIKEQDGNPIYHHFKVVAENTSGMLSSEENILTI